MGNHVIQFIREIPEERIVQREINDLEQCGFTLIWGAKSLRIYSETE